MQKTQARALTAGLILSLTAGVLSATVLTPAPSQDVSDARAMLTEWVDVERAISLEKRDWALGKELLTDRIGIVQDEIAATRDEIEAARANIATTEEKFAELAVENDALKVASSSLESRVLALEARTRGLLAKLPPPIVERVSVLSARLPKEGAETKASLGERFQNIVGILNEVNKFHGDVAMFSEVRTLEDGTSAEVSTLYVGISQAFYATSDLKHAGIGRGGKQGWEWLPANEAAPAIAQAIAIFNSEEPAAFVHLPLQVD